VSGGSFYRPGGWQGKEMRGQGGIRMEERDGRREGGPGTVVDGRHRPVAVERGQVAHAHTVRHRAGNAGS
jgi:hypothetical protein